LNIVALDLATKTGWAYGHAHSGFPVFGTYKIDTSADEPGAFYVNFSQWLGGFLDSARAVIVVFESPVLPRLTRIQTLRRLYWLAGQVELFCAYRRIECYEAAPSAVKKSWVGSGAAKKADMVAMAKARGYNVTDDNQADALALWHYYVQRHAHGGGE
jgi:crossover junction endodeoxyribonuclease RuvC